MIAFPRFAKFFASGTPQQRAISLECGLQNGTLAVFVGTQLFDDMVYMVPTAAYATFHAHQLAEGLAYLEQQSLPIVLKADGLAAGKGVVICNNELEALAEFELMIQRAKLISIGC